MSITITEPIIEKSGKNIVLVLDISKSMLAEDIHPNRLDRAKSVLRTFFERPSGDHFSYIVFAGKPFLLSPLTDDRIALQKMVDITSPDMIKQELPGVSGTNIGDALILASTMVHGQSGAIILMTDGRANLGIDPILAAKTISEQGKTPIFTIGIGNLSGSVLSYTDEDGQVQYFYNEKGEKLKADIDESMLQRIAEITGGSYAHADNADHFSTIFSRLESIVKTPVRYTSITHSISLSSVLVVFFCLFLVLHHECMRYIRRKYRF